MILVPYFKKILEQPGWDAERRERAATLVTLQDIPYLAEEGMPFEEVRAAALETAKTVEEVMYAPVTR
jgi:hypothetical protein